MVKLIVVNNIKKVVKGINVAGDVPEALNKKIEDILRNAMVRARANGRRTVQGKDI